MNIILAIFGAILMNLGGYIIVSQVISAMNAAPYITHEVPMLALGGLVLNGLGFFLFFKSIHG